MAEVTCEATTPAPAATTTRTGDYTVTEADAARGTVINVAAASGRSGAAPRWCHPRTTSRFR